MVLGSILQLIIHVIPTVMESFLPLVAQFSFSIGGQILSGIIGGLVSLLIVEIVRRPKMEIEEGIWKGKTNNSKTDCYRRSVRLRNSSLKIPLIHKILPRDKYFVRRRPAINCTARISFERDEIDSMSYPVYFEEILEDRKAELDIYSGQSVLLPIAIFFEEAEGLYIPDREENSPSDSSGFEKRKFELIVEAKENVKASKKYCIEKIDLDEREVKIKEI